MSDLGFRASRRSAQVCTAVLRVARSGPSRAYRTSRARASSPYCRDHACRRQGWAVSAAILADGMPSSVRNVHVEPYWRSSWRSLSVWPGRPQRPATARYCNSPTGCGERDELILHDQMNPGQDLGEAGPVAVPQPDPAGHPVGPASPRTGLPQSDRVGAHMDAV